MRQRRGDSLTNGAIIGAVAGTAYFLTGLALLGDSDGGDVIVSTAVVGGGVVRRVGRSNGSRNRCADYAPTAGLPEARRRQQKPVF